LGKEDEGTEEESGAGESKKEDPEGRKDVETAAEEEEDEQEEEEYNATTKLYNESNRGKTEMTVKRFLPCGVSISPN
jgi:hypothetical protein